jgi:hypothetical protein
LSKNFAILFYLLVGVAVIPLSPKVNSWVLAVASYACGNPTGGVEDTIKMFFDDRPFVRELLL